MEKRIWNQELHRTDGQGETMIHITDKITPKCPECGEPMLAMYGCGWDTDKFICSQFMCDGEIELDTTTYPEPQAEDTCKE